MYILIILCSEWKYTCQILHIRDHPYSTSYFCGWEKVQSYAEVSIYMDGPSKVKSLKTLEHPHQNLKSAKFLAWKAKNISSKPFLFCFFHACIQQSMFQILIWVFYFLKACFLDWVSFKYAWRTLILNYPPCRPLDPCSKYVIKCYIRWYADKKR